MLIRCRNRDIFIDSNDEILYNGACYQITTKPYSKNFYDYLPVIALSKAEKLIKEGILVIKRTEKSGFGNSKLVYYKIQEE